VVVFVLTLSSWQLELLKVFQRKHSLFPPFGDREEEREEGKKESEKERERVKEREV